MKKNLTLLASAFLAVTGFAQTGNPAPYCISQFDNNYNMVQSVAINATNFNVGPIGSWGAQNSYTFFNNAVFPSLSLNGTATVSISFYSVSDWEPRYFGVWIDYNQNTTFDPGELIMNNANTTFTDLPTGGGAAPGTASMVITVPGTASPGVTRMRLVRSENSPSPYAPYSSTVQVPACNPVTANFAYGCTYDFSLNILGGAPVADFTVSPANLCTGQAATLTDLSTNTPSTWTWSAVGATNSLATTQNSSLVYTAPGTYTIGLTAGNSAGVSALVTKTITVKASPQLTLSPANVSICAKKNATITVNGASTYSWNTGATGTAVVVSPSATTVYTVVGTATNGCSSALSKTVNVVSCVGLNELTGYSEENAVVFPNPASTIISVMINDSGDDLGTIRIYNALGELIVQKEASANFQLDVSAYQKGVYYIEHNKNATQTRTIKLILQ
jgi:PKD repeat protein